MPWEFFDRSASAVEANLGAMNARADAGLAQANTVLGALASFSLGSETTAPPDMTFPEILIEKIDGDEPNTGLFSFDDSFDKPTFDDLWSNIAPSLETGFGIEVPEFKPTVGNPQIPPPPEPIDTSGMPTKPPLDPITFPSEPNYLIPEIGDLVPITIPAFDFPDMPTFTATEPVFDGVTPNTSLLFEEPVYQSEVLDDVKTEIIRIMSGGTGLTTEIQQALFDAARAREHQTALSAKQQAYDEWAGRGFGMPPGMLVSAVNAAIERSELAENALERDILSKAAQWEIENLRFAVQQGLAYEGLLINMFNNAAQRSFDAAKFRVEADLKLYDAAVALFNARQSAYRVAAEVLKALIEAEMAKIEVYKAQIQGEIAKGQLNEQTVRVYEGRLKGVQQLVEIYKATMETAKIRSEVNRTIIEGFRVETEAFGEFVKAKKTEFDAYDSEIKGEATKAQIYEAQARAFGETVRAAETEGNLKARYIESRAATMRSSVDKFVSNVTAERERVNVGLEALRAQVAGFQADVARYSAELNADERAQSTALQVAESRLRSNVAYYETRVREYDQALNRVIERAKLGLEGMRAAGQMASTLAAGAMSAIHVAANMHGNATVSDSKQEQQVTHINR